MNKYRAIFEQFNNLNLLTLINNLEMNFVAKGSLIAEKIDGNFRRMCPLQHGRGFLRTYVQSKLSIRDLQGLQSEFALAWDGAQISPEELLALLREIWNERLLGISAAPTFTPRQAEVLNITEALKRNRNNLLRTACDLGISLIALSKKLRRITSSSGKSRSSDPSHLLTQLNPAKSSASRLLSQARFMKVWNDKHTTRKERLALIRMFRKGRFAFSDSPPLVHNQA